MKYVKYTWCMTNRLVMIIERNCSVRNTAAPRKKAVTDIFSIFPFFAKNYNLVNALSCVLVIFLEKKINAWKRVFSVLQKAVSAFVPTKFVMFPQGKKQYLHPQGKKQYLQR